MRLKFILIFVLPCLLFSCSIPKDVTYFQGLETLTPDQLAAMNQSYISRICTDDLLTITVTSWDPSVVTPFNPPVYAFGGQGEARLEQSPQLQTYLVDKDGYINFPVLGKVKAGGFSKQELADQMQKQISHYVKDALVNVQIVNFKISVIGEVNKPGPIEVTNDRISILDALSYAEDLTINGNRTNILVLRDTNGEKEFAYLDITRPDIFTSPFYYLQQNDVIYVEPNKAKKKNANYSQAEQFNMSIFSTIVSITSIITTMVLALIKL